MKISISGPFSSGKTTLVEALARQLPESLVLKEYARSLKEEHPLIDWTDPVIRNHVLFAQIALEAQFEKQQTNLLLCDSGLLDCMAHSLAFGLPIHSHIAERYHTKRYDLVFCCDPADVPLEDDGLRFTDGDLQQRLNEAFQTVSAGLGYEPIRLSGDIGTRVKRVLEELGRHANRASEI